MAAIGREGGESRSAAARQTRQPKTADRELTLTVSRDGAMPTSTTRPVVRSADSVHTESEVRTAM